MEPYLEKLLSKSDTQNVKNKKVDTEISEYPYLKNHFPKYSNLKNPKEYDFSQKYLIKDNNFGPTKVVK